MTTPTLPVSRNTPLFFTQIRLGLQLFLLQLFPSLCPPPDGDGDACVALPCLQGTPLPFTSNPFLHPV